MHYQRFRIIIEKSPHFTHNCMEKANIISLSKYKYKHIASVQCETTFLNSGNVQTFPQSKKPKMEMMGPTTDASIPAT